jgi:hypothetical protein
MKRILGWMTLSLSLVVGYSLVLLTILGIILLAGLGIAWLVGENIANPSPLIILTDVAVVLGIAMAVRCKVIRSQIKVVWGQLKRNL